MILKHFYPEKDFPIKRLNGLLKIGNRKMYCFPDMVVAVLSDLGIDSKYYTTSDDVRWYKEGKNYLLKNNPKDVAEKIWKMSNQKISKPFFRRVLKEKRYVRKKLSFNDIGRFFKKGYLVSPIININALENRKGYAGHAVIITGIGKDFVTFHDPGLPPVPNNKIRKRDFIRAWRAQGTDDTVVVAFGKKMQG
jgi:hypothetical protein